MVRDLGIDELFAVGSELRQRPGLVRFHEPAVSDHVGGEDRCESALDPLHGHQSSPNSDHASGENATPDCQACPLADRRTPKCYSSATVRRPLRISSVKV